MRCIVVRHGKAERSAPSGEDADRALAPMGIRQAEFLGHQCAARPPSLILASRFERARHTAQVIQRATGAPLELLRELEVGHPCSTVLRALAAHAGRSPLMLVGHNPQLSELVWLLTRGVPAQEAGLRTGEAVLLDVDPQNLVGAGREIERLRLDEDD
jgi:phosphohistidine phosphatase